MKFSLVLMVLGAASGSAFSAVDYSYCQKQFNTYVQSNKPCTTKFGVFTYCAYSSTKTQDSSYFPFELTDDGKIKAHPSLNYKSEDGKEILSSGDKSGMGMETVITRNDKGEISGVTTKYKMKNGFGGIYGSGIGIGSQQAIAKNSNSFERTNETNIKLEIKNGKCIPSRVDTVNSLGDESRQDVNFDAKLCRNLAQFFKKNPEAASCFDKNLMESAQNIFNDYYKDNKDIYGETTPRVFTTPKPQRTRLKSEAAGSYGYPGTGSVGFPGGWGMGMPGATTEQMLTPMTPSVDSILGAGKMPGLATTGFGTSPVVSAMQVLTLCQGGAYGQTVLHDVIYDESVWKTEAPQESKAEAAKGVQK